jgi:O-antigen/teichoic acid export membrane protein
MGQVLIVALLPLITSLYSPGDMGVLAVYRSILLTLAVVATLRYETAIPVPKQDHEALSLLKLCFLVLLASVFATACLLIPTGPLLVSALKIPRLEPYLWMIPLGLLCVGSFQVVTFMAIRNNAFKPLAVSRFIQSAATALIPVVAFPLGLVALLMAQMLGQSMGFLRLYHCSVHLPRPFISKNEFLKIKQVAVRFRGYALFSTSGGLFDTLGSVCPELLFSALFSPTMAGLYILGLKVVAMPMGMIMLSISNVFFGGARQRIDEGTFTAQVCSIHNRLSRISTPILVVLALYAPTLFEIAFGGRWAESGRFTQLLTPMLYFQFISVPLNQIFSILEKPRGVLISNLVVFLLRVAGIYLGFSVGSQLQSVLYFSLFSALGYFMFSCSTTHLAGVPFRCILRDHFSALGIALLVGLPALLVERIQGSPVSGIIIAVLSATACYLHMGKQYYRETKIEKNVK